MFAEFEDDEDDYDAVDEAEVCTWSQRLKREP
jgi:hypothetical protein